MSESSADGTEERARIRRYYDSIAPVWTLWRRRHKYYHESLIGRIKGIIPPGSAVLELGTGTGDALEALKPGRGVGNNVSALLTEMARRSHPRLEFHTAEVDQVVLPEGFRPEYVVVNNVLDYVYDVWEFLENIRRAVPGDFLLIITTNNPLWTPFLRAASRVGWRMPDSPRNAITNKDIRSVLALQGFDVVEEGMALPAPVYVPLLSGLINTIFPELPGLRYVSSVQHITARPRTPRPLLSTSVIIPCHNEAGSIADCLRRIPPELENAEILVVDDGSTDETRRRVQELMAADPRLRLLGFDENRGKAAAVRAGFEAATGDVLVILDADNTVRPEEIPRFLKPLRSGYADFINGTRLVYPVDGEAMGFLRFLGNKTFCYLASWILRQRVSDTLCGTKVLFRRDFQRMSLLKKDRWGDFDLLFGAAQLKLRIMEIPVRYQGRKQGKSKMRVIRDGLTFLRTCWFGWRMLRFPGATPWRQDETRANGGP